MEGGGGCCCCCSSLLLGILGTVFLFWLHVHLDKLSNRTYSIQDFYLPALNTSLTNSSLNTNVYFLLNLENSKFGGSGIYYDALNLTVSFSPNQTHNIPIGNTTLPGFYQGVSKKAHRNVSVETGGVNWEAAASGRVSNGTVIFRVDLVTAVRSKILGSIKSKRHKMKVGANVGVNDHGTTVDNKAIKLKSGAPKYGCYRALLGMLPIFSVFLLNY